MPLLGDNVEQLVNEINDSFESEHDRTEPRLMLCMVMFREIHDSKLLLTLFEYQEAFYHTPRLNFLLTFKAG